MYNGLGGMDRWTEREMGFPRISDSEPGWTGPIFLYKYNMYMHTCIKHSQEPCVSCIPIWKPAAQQQSQRYNEFYTL